MPEAGTLYIIPTPIGNLEDITYRALRLLKEADLILAEDTRTTRFLLNHYGIEGKLHSHHKFNEHHTAQKVVEQLQGGLNIALVSDAGTPAISDPGFLLTRACIEADVPVECLPGATAIIPALVLSGLPNDRFVFEGFLPHKKGRKTKLEKLAEEERTMVLYESPHRIAKTLKQLGEFLGEERQVCLCREISKKFEESLRGTLGELAQIATDRKLKGEMVLVVAGKGKG